MIYSTPSATQGTNISRMSEPQKSGDYKSIALPIELSRQIGTKCLLFRLSVDPNASHFHHFRDLYTPDSHQVGKMRTDYRLRVSYIVIYSRFQAKCPCGFRRCLLLHSPYLRYSDFTLRVPSGYIFQQHNRIVSQCVQRFCFFTLLILLTYINQNYAVLNHYQ